MGFRLYSCGAALLLLMGVVRVHWRLVAGRLDGWTARREVDVDVKTTVAVNANPYEHWNSYALTTTPTFTDFI
jgi:hypothetical protein